jgi:hypothetical protein
MSKEKERENIGDGDVSPATVDTYMTEEDAIQLAIQMSLQKDSERKYGDEAKDIETDKNFVDDDAIMIDKNFAQTFLSMQFNRAVTEEEKEYLSSAYKEHVLGASIMPEDIDWSGIIARFDFYVSTEDTNSNAYVKDPLAELRLRQRLDQIEALNGPKLQPLYCTPDGNCLPYAISRSLVGSEILYSGIRQQIVLEMTNNSKYYLQFCGESVEFLKDMIEDARKNEAFLEEIHTQALSNILKRPIAWFDKESNKTKNKLFLPTRFKRSECLFEDTKQMPSIIAIGWGAENHFISLVVEKKEDDVPLKSHTLNESILTYDKLSQLLQFILELRNLQKNLKENGITLEAIANALQVMIKYAKKWQEGLVKLIKNGKTGLTHKRPQTEWLFEEFSVNYDDNDEGGEEANTKLNIVNKYAFIKLFLLFAAVVEAIPNVVSQRESELYELLHSVLVAEYEATVNDTSLNISVANNNDDSINLAASIIKGCIVSTHEKKVFHEIFGSSYGWDKAREEYGNEYNDNGIIKKGWLFGTGKDGWGGWLDEKKQMLKKNFHAATYDAVDDHAVADVNEHFESMVDGDLRIKYNCRICNHQEIERVGNPARVQVHLSNMPCTQPNCCGTMIPWEGHEKRSTLQSNFIAKLMGTFSAWVCSACSFENKKLHTTCAACHTYRTQPLSEKIVGPIVLEIDQKDDYTSNNNRNISIPPKGLTASIENLISNVNDETMEFNSKISHKSKASNVIVGLKRQLSEQPEHLHSINGPRIKRAESAPTGENEIEQLLTEKFKSNIMLNTFDLDLIKAAFRVEGRKVIDRISKMPSAKRRKRSSA